MNELEINIISTAGLKPPAREPDVGVPSKLRWLDIDLLYVDSRYQREITEASKRNIKKIADEFDWAFFSPVIVSPFGDFFVIIDGQHRTTAAKLVGRKAVPCCIINMNRAKQALAFVRINGTVTKVSDNARLRAARAAGERWAVDLHAACVEGGVRIAPAPLMHGRMKVGDSNAVQALRRCLEKFGHEAFVRACRALTQSPRKYVAMINRDLVWGLCLALEPYAACSREDVQAMCDKVDLEGISRAAKMESARTGVKRQQDLVCAALERAFLLEDAPPGFLAVSQAEAALPVAKRTPRR